MPLYQFSLTLPAQQAQMTLIFHVIFNKIYILKNCKKTLKDRLGIKPPVTIPYCNLMALYGNYVGNGSLSSLKVVSPDYMSSGNKLKNSFKMETFWVSTLKTNKPPTVKDE